MWQRWRKKLFLITGNGEHSPEIHPYIINCNQFRSAGDQFTSSLKGERTLLSVVTASLNCMWSCLFLQLYSSYMCTFITLPFIRSIIPLAEEEPGLLPVVTDKLCFCSTLRHVDIYIFCHHRWSSGRWSVGGQRVLCFHNSKQQWSGSAGWIWEVGGD